MKQKIMIFTLLCAIFLANCATQRIHTTSDQSAKIPSFEGTSHFFLYGIGQTKEYSAKQICHNRVVATVETYYSFVNGLLSGLTSGIYTPMSYTIYCGKKIKKKVKVKSDEDEDDEEED